MGVPKLVRKSQVLGAVESVSGVAEVLDASDGKARIIVGAGFEPDLPTEPRGIARASMTNLGSLPGQKAGSVTFRSEVNTPDTITADTEFLAFLQGCSLTVNTLSSVGVGAIAGGPYERNEIITGTTSGATGRVVKEATDGDDIIYYEILTDNFEDAETITGGTSGATATSDTAETDAGHLIQPISDGQKTCTVEYQEDGYAWSVKGAMSNLVGAFEASKPGYFDFNFQGPKNTFGDKALTTGITRDDDEPPILQCAEMTINGVTVVFHTIGFDMGNNVVHRVDGNSCDTGIIADFISAREPKITVSFEHLPASTLDVFTQLANATKIPILFTLGQTVGKKIMFWADLAQITEIGMGDADGIRTVDVGMMLTGASGSGDDEFEFAMM